MGVKKILRSYPLIVDGVMSGTNTIDMAQSQNIENFDNIGLQISWSGTPVGTISVLCSIDNVNFVPLSFSPGLNQPAGSASSILISLNQVPYPYLKVSYTNTSGSGLLNVLISQKDLN